MNYAWRSRSAGESFWYKTDLSTSISCADDASSDVTIVFWEGESDA